MRRTHLGKALLLRLGCHISTMTVTGRSAGAIAAILLVARAAFPFATDQESAPCFSSAAQMDAAGNGTARDAIIQEIRTELRSRIAADSASESASRFWNCSTKSSRSRRRRENV
jgi:hypothetical protein